MENTKLAAIYFDDGQNVDALFNEIAISLIEEGQNVVGVLQARGLSQGECHCSDMDLQVIGSDRVFRISQPLGEGSSGCRLHPGALAECSAYLHQQMKQDCDLLILNRFGKGESEGRGFRDLIICALDAGIPVLMAARPTYQVAFQDFAGDLGVELPFDKLAIQAWLLGKEQSQAA